MVVGANDAWNQKGVVDVVVGADDAWNQNNAIDIHNEKYAQKFTKARIKNIFNIEQTVGMTLPKYTETRRCRILHYELV